MYWRMEHDLPGRIVLAAGTSDGHFATRRTLYNQPRAIVNRGGGLAREPAAPPDGTGQDAASPAAGTVAAMEQAPSALRCAACRAVITDESRRITVNGSHEHVFANPYGMVFRLGCFAAAPGVVGLGAPSAAFSWFAGTVWRIVVCAACGAHLGWRYDRGGGGFFFGLLLDRLVSGGPAATPTDH